MVLLTDIKGKKRKVTATDRKKITNYQGLPEVYNKVTELLKKIQGDRTISWKQQKKI